MSQSESSSDLLEPDTGLKTEHMADLLDGIALHLESDRAVDGVYELDGESYQAVKYEVDGEVIVVAYEDDCVIYTGEPEGEFTEFN